jgi:N-formylglutamate amidohydrolase
MITTVILVTIQALGPAQKSAVESKLIVTQKGEIPIIISAPHGGTLEIPGAALRTKRDTPQFSTAWDTRTDLLAENCGEQIFKLTGKKPYLVIAKFSRKYADANRSEINGTESEVASEVHREYHKLLQQYSKSVFEQFGKGLLIDIHGQGSEKSTVFRGTNNRNSVKGFSEEMFTGPKSFLGVLEFEGFNLTPKNAATTEKENTNYTGGFITQTYGAKGRTGLMAIQLEFGAEYRQKENIPKIAESFAKAIQSHWITFLQNP